MDRALLCNVHHLLHRCIWVAIFKIELNGVIEEDSILWHDTNVLPKALELEVPQVLAINVHTALGGVIYPEQEVQHGGLAEARGADDGIRGACLD